MTSELKTRWPVAVLAISAGVAAAAAIGKVPPALELLRREYSLSLVYGGWIISIFSALALATGAGFGTLQTASDRGACCSRACGSWLGPG